MDAKLEHFLYASSVEDAIQLVNGMHTQTKNTCKFQSVVFHLTLCFVQCMFDCIRLIGALKNMSAIKRIKTGILMQALLHKLQNGKTRAAYCNVFGTHFNALIHRRTQN